MHTVSAWELVALSLLLAMSAMTTRGTSLLRIVSGNHAQACEGSGKPRLAVLITQAAGCPAGGSAAPPGTPFGPGGIFGPGKSFVSLATQQHLVVLWSEPVPYRLQCCRGEKT